MKKLFFLILISILSLNCYSQVSFEKGYYINNSDQKINCLIKMVDWNNNPTEFKYKLFEDDETKKVTIKSVKEFGINNTSKYIRANVNIDRSVEVLNRLSTGKSPKFKEEELFLKVLIEGKSTLYQYVDNGITKYFYKTEDLNIEQLVFKSYKTNEGKIAQNNQFRQQLLINLKCENFDSKRIEKVDYQKNDLVQFFIKYHECQNSDLSYLEPKIKRDVFNLTLRPRFKNSSLTVQNTRFNQRDIIDFGNKTGYGFGIEAEVVLPINKNKWSIIIEPTYQSFKAETINNDINVVFGGTLISQADYTSVEVPVGLRHYFFLNNHSKIFINASVVFDLSSKSLLEFENPLTSIVSSQEIIETGENFGFGVGYKAYDRYSVELRYQTSRDLLEREADYTSSYKTVSIILGYSLF